MAGLVVPLVIWSAPPSHIVTCAALSPDASLLATGAANGGVCLWSIAHNAQQVDERVKPKLMLLGGESAIVGLTYAHVPSVEVALITLTEKGALCVWDAQTGRCRGNNDTLLRAYLGNGAPSRLITLPDKRHVAIAGESNEAIIIDLWRLEVTRTLQGHNDWILDVGACNLGGSEYHPFLLSLCIDGTLRFDSLLSPISQFPLKTVILPSAAATTLNAESDNTETLTRRPSTTTLSSTGIGSSEFDPTEALLAAISARHEACFSVTVGPNAKTILAVNPRHWMLYAACTVRSLYCVECPEMSLGELWAGASYLDNTHIAVWTTSGVVYVYNVPEEVNNLPALVFSAEEHLAAAVAMETSQSHTGSPQLGKHFAPRAIRRTGLIASKGSSKTRGGFNAIKQLGSALTSSVSSHSPFHTPREENSPRRSLSPQPANNDDEEDEDYESNTTMTGEASPQRTLSPPPASSSGVNTPTAVSTPEMKNRTQPTNWRLTSSPLDSAALDETKAVVQTQEADDDGEAWTDLASGSERGAIGREIRRNTSPYKMEEDTPSSLELSFNDKATTIDIIKRTSPVLKHKLVAKGTVASEGKGTFRRHVPKVCCWKNAVFVISEDGRVAVWHIPDLESGPTEVLSLSSLIRTDYDANTQQRSGEEEEEKEKEARGNLKASKLLMKEWATARIKDGWKGIKEGGAGVPVSSMLFLEEDFILARGYQNGDLELAQLPWGDPAIDRVVRGAHKGAILALLSYRNNTRRYLISAGADNIIKVWSLKLGKTGLSLVHTFRHHAGPVTHLFRVSPQHSNEARAMLGKKPRGVGAGSYESGVFLSISKDKSVGLFSLENMNCMRIFAGHPSQITRVSWRVEQDYLFVTCDDGSLSLWGLNTGVLESCVYGQTADDIGTNNTFYPTRNRVTVKNVAQNGTVSAFTMRPSPKEPPMVVIELDIKNMSRELYTQAKTPPTDEGRISKTPNITSHHPHNAMPRVSSVGVIQGMLSTAAGSGLSNASSITSYDGVGGEGMKRLYGLAAYQAFTYLLPWRIDADLDNMCEAELVLRPPVPDVNYAVKSGKGMLAALVPAASDAGGRWQCSDLLSGLHTLSSVTISKALLHLGNKNAISRLLSFYCGMLPDTIKGFVCPSLPFVAHYYLDLNDDVQSSARAIFSSTTTRLSSEELRQLAQSWAQLLGSTESDSARMNVILVLAILGSESPECLAPTVAAEVGLALSQYIKQKDHPLRLAATELLGRGFRTWHPHLKDVKALIRSLFALTLLSEPISLSGTASRSLMLIGATEPRMAIDGLGELIYRPDLGAKEHSDALMLISQLVRKHPSEIFGELPRLVETVVHALDPNVPHLREGCLRAATQVLHSLVKQYPMVSFHSTQRFAVGTPKGVIIIWDLKTASRLHVLEGHKGPVTAVAFSNKGDVLASYSVGDARVLFWSSKASIMSLFASSPSVVHACEVTRVRSMPPVNQILETVRLQWSGDRAVELTRGWEGSTILKF